MYKEDFAIYDVIFALLCDAPPPPLWSASGAHSHSLADDDTPVWKVAKRSRVSKLVVCYYAS